MHLFACKNIHNAGEQHIYIFYKWYHMVFKIELTEKTLYCQFFSITHNQTQHILVHHSTNNPLKTTCYPIDSIILVNKIADVST